MEKFRILVCFLVVLLALFIINGVFLAVIVFVKVLKLILIAGVIAFVYYLMTKKDKKNDGEGV